MTLFQSSLPCSTEIHKNQLDSNNDYTSRWYWRDANGQIGAFFDKRLPLLCHYILQSTTEIIVTTARLDNERDREHSARVTKKDGDWWVPVRDGVSFRPLRFLPASNTYVALLRVESNTEIKLHRHTGQIHAYNLVGHRELGTGETIVEGDYVFEPTGNQDTWRVNGEGHTEVLIVVEGEVQYLDSGGNVLGSSSWQTLLDSYLAYCRDHAIEPLDIIN